MKVYAGLGFAAGILIVVSAAAHAFLGWPSLSAALATEGVGADTMHAAQIGWHWGSFCMLCFGAIIVAQAGSAMRGVTPNRVVVAAITLTYLAFGLWTYIGSGFNPHFLLFIGTGLLVSPLLLVRAPQSTLT